MCKVIINGGKPSKGEVVISGAKDSVVTLIPTAILVDGVVILDGIPAISDVDSLVEIMEVMGTKVKRKEDILKIDLRGIKNQPVSYGKIDSLCTSCYSYGSLLSRSGEATVGLPGGCDLGPCPINLHFRAFEAMGVTISYEGEAVCLATNGESTHGVRVYMDTASAGVTINAMFAAARANDRTIIENTAHEPEIIDVATLSNSVEAHIRDAGTDVVTTGGVDYLYGTRHQVIPNRVEAGAYIAMIAATSKGVRITNVLCEYLENCIAKLEEMGVRMTTEEDSIFAKRQSVLKTISVKISPYPDFATDLQQLITSLLLIAEGRGTILDTIYERRTNCVVELVQMGADISIVGGRITYQGPNKLTGASVKVSDLRASAALVIADLMAEGQTEITNAEFILRGYPNIIEKLTALGADTKSIED